MQTDKNKPQTWRPFKPSLCRSCYATCCTMPLEVRLEDLVTMGLVSKEDLAEETNKKKIHRIVKHLQKEGIVKTYRSSTGLFLMNSQPNGDCQFLDGQRHCLIYSKRPQVCRQFPESMGLKLGHCPYQRK